MWSREDVGRRSATCPCVLLWLLEQPSGRGSQPLGHCPCTAIRVAVPALGLRSRGAVCGVPLLLGWRRIRLRRGGLPELLEGLVGRCPAVRAPLVFLDLSWEPRPGTAAGASCVARRPSVDVVQKRRMPLLQRKQWSTLSNGALSCSLDSCQHCISEAAMETVGVTTRRLGCVESQCVDTACGGGRRPHRRRPLELGCERGPLLAPHPRRFRCR